MTIIKDNRIAKAILNKIDREYNLKNLSPMDIIIAVCLVLLYILIAEDYTKYKTL